MANYDRNMSTITIRIDEALKVRVAAAGKTVGRDAARAYLDARARGERLRKPAARRPKA